MHGWKVPALIEPVPIIDDFVQGIACIERVGPCARFVLFSDQTMVEAGNVKARVIVRKIIIPMDALPGAIAQATDFIALRAFANVFRIRG
jgi:hypothetical protein